MALSCEDVRALLDEDDSLDTAEAREHMAGCPECRVVANRWAQVSTRLEEMGDEAPPPFLHGRVMAHVRSARDSRRRLWWVPALATALVVVVVGVWRGPMDSPELVSPDAPIPSSATAPVANPTSVAPSVRPRTASPLGPLRGAKRSGSEPDTVCILVRADGESRPVLLPAAWAPPRDAEWALVVADSGEVGPEGKAGTVPFEPLEVLAAARLRPGRYVLRRAERSSP